jgi:hypothetical protein
MKILKQIFTTKIGWLVVSLLLTFGFGVISNECNLFLFEILMYLSLIYPLTLLIIMMINAIKNRNE